MWAVLDHTAVVQHHDPVGSRCGGQPVGDDEDGTAPAVALGGQPVRSSVDRSLGGKVERGSGLVQQQDVRIHQLGPGQGDHGSGQGDPLALPIGQRQALLSDHRVVAEREFPDETVRLGRLRCGDHLRVGGLWPASP